MHSSTGCRILRLYDGKTILFPEWVHRTCNSKTSPTHSFFIQVDREHQDNVLPQKDKADLEKTRIVNEVLGVSRVFYDSEY